MEDKDGVDHKSSNPIRFSNSLRTIKGLHSSTIDLDTIKVKSLKKVDSRCNSPDPRFWVCSEYFSPRLDELEFGKCVASLLLEYYQIKVNYYGSDKEGPICMVSVEDLQSGEICLCRKVFPSFYSSNRNTMLLELLNFIESETEIYLEEVAIND